MQITEVFVYYSLVSNLWTLFKSILEMHIKTKYTGVSLGKTYLNRFVASTSNSQIKMINYKINLNLTIALYTNKTCHEMKYTKAQNNIIHTRLIFVLGFSCFSFCKGIGVLFKLNTFCLFVLFIICYAYIDNHTNVMANG